MSTEHPYLSLNGDGDDTARRSRMSSFDTSDHERKRPHKKKACCCGKLTEQGCSICIGVSLLFVIGAILLIQYWAIPFIAQKTIDGSKIEFTSMAIGEATGFTSFQVSVNALLSDAGSYDATISEMTMHVFYGSGNLGTVTLPATTVKANTPTAITAASVFYIGHNETFLAFTAALVREPSVEWHVTAKIDMAATIMGMKFNFKSLDMDKYITIKGLNGLKDIEIRNPDPKVSTATQVIVALESRIFNPSVISMTDLGQLEFDVMYKNMKMGTMISKGVKILSGNNFMNMTSFIKPADSMAVEVTELMSLLLSGQPVPVKAVGSKTASTIPLFNNALVGLALSAILHMPYNALITNVELPSVQMKFFPENPKRIDMTMSAVVSINSPLGPNCPVNIRAVSLHASLFTFDKPGLKTNGTAVFGEAISPLAEVIDGDKPVVKFTATATVTLSDPDAFSYFGEAFVVNEYARILMQGVSRVDLTSVIGNMTLTNMPIDNQVKMKALDNLKDVHMDVFALSITGGVPNQLDSLVKVGMNNPSVVSFDLGQSSNLHLECHLANGTIIGTSLVPQFILNSGNNNNTYSVLMNEVPNHPEILADMLSKYLTGQEIPVTIKTAPAPSSVFPYLDRMMSHLVLPTTIHGLKLPLLKAARMKVSLLNLALEVPTSLTSVNPFDTDMILLGMNCDILYQGSVVGVLSHDISDNPFTMPAGQTVDTPFWNTAMTATFATLKAIFTSIGGIDFSMRGTLTCQVGGFQKSVYYEQPVIHSTIVLI